MNLFGKVGKVHAVRICVSSTDRKWSSYWSPCIHTSRYSERMLCWGYSMTNPWDRSCPNDSVSTIQPIWCLKPYWLVAEQHCFHPHTTKVLGLNPRGWGGGEGSIPFGLGFVVFHPALMWVSSGFSSVLHTERRTAEVDGSARALEQGTGRRPGGGAMGLCCHCPHLLLLFLLHGDRSPW